MDDDSDPWFLIKFIRETIGHQKYTGAPMLPPKTDNRPTLVLDLDETLVKKGKTFTVFFNTMAVCIVMKI